MTHSEIQSWRTDIWRGILAQSNVDAYIPSIQPKNRVMDFQLHGLLNTCYPCWSASVQLLDDNYPTNPGTQGAKLLKHRLLADGEEKCVLLC